VHDEVLVLPCTMSTIFGAGSLSHFPFNKWTRLNALPHAGSYTAGVGNYGCELWSLDDSTLNVCVVA